MRRLPMIVDAHLDLAYNALRGRDLLRSAEHQRADEEGTPSVSLPDLRAGGVGMVCATIFCEPAAGADSPGYRTPEEAARMAREQLAWYRRLVESGQMRIVRSGKEVPVEQEQRLPAILLMEGADPIGSMDELGEWYAEGLRIVGLAWKRTRYAGGTGAPGPLTPAGIELVGELDRLGILHDVSHLAEESFWQLMERARAPVLASHSNCRALVPTDRQLSDEMIRALAARGGVIGVNFFERFLLPPEELGSRPASLEDVVRHIRHICDVVGSADHVGLGTDMDGGFGRERLPRPITTSADLPKLSEVLKGHGFTDHETAGVLGANWVRFFRQALGQKRTS